MKFWELAVGVVLFAALTLFLMEIEAFELFYEFSRDHEDWDLDEAVMGLLAFLFAVIVSLLLSARRRARELEEANRLKSVFLANMSHDLRTPLNAIMGFSDILRHELVPATDTEKRNAYANGIYASSQQVLELVNTILDITAIEAGERVLEPQDFNMEDLLARCRDEIAGRATEKAIGIEIIVGAGLPPFQADPQPLIQMISNLLDNAVKFTEPGGYVSVRCGSDKGRPTISVTDTGVGIPQHRLRRVMEPFTKSGDDPYDAAEKGSGLGLAKVKTHMEAHGGKVLIDSKEGAGTTVTLVFPITGATTRQQVA